MDGFAKAEMQLEYLQGVPIDELCRRRGMLWKDVAAICNHPWPRPAHIDEKGGIIFDSDGQPLGMDLHGASRVVGID